MKGIKDLKVVYKMGIMVAVAVIAVLLVGMIGKLQLAADGRELNRICGVQLKAVEDIGDAALSVRAMQSRILKGMQADDTSDVMKYQQESKKYADTYEESWQSYTASGNVSEAQRQEIEQTWTAYRAAARKSFELAAAGKKPEAQAEYAGSCADKIASLLKDMDTLQAQEKQTIETMSAEGAASNERSEMMMLVCMVLFSLILLAVSIWMARMITYPLSVMDGICERLQQGDFRKSPHLFSSEDEFGAMHENLVEVRHNVRELMQKIYKNVEHLAASSEELTASSTSTAKASGQAAQLVTDAAADAENQKESIDLGNVSVQEIDSSILKIQDEASEASDDSTQAAEQALMGSKAIEASVEKMQQIEKSVNDSAATIDVLGKRSQEIGEIIDTISSIANETNLLALNAAIEAARAGEQGRGFAVVAENVRKLAEQSKAATEHITQLIKAIQDDTAKAVQAMQEGRSEVVAGTEEIAGLKEMFAQIHSRIQAVSTKVAHTSAAVAAVTGDTQKVTDEIEKIGEHGSNISAKMQSVAATTEEQSASSEEIASASEALSKMAQDFQTALSKFKFQ
jgi:methyl-accepting chemotaxis protein